MGLRTPYAKVTGKGATGGGTDHFWAQRVSALANVPLTLFLVWLVTRLAGGARAEMVELLGNPIVAGLLVLTIISVCWHMALGLAVVIEDYVHAEGLKIILIIGNKFFAFSVAAMSIMAVLKLSFGA
ncbi:MAG: succinate dehydrogenase, hydrophobic membrane anchor protein [Devosiaceae bacterium]|nr:succinate dehydrogenase, hydrophobic membrane anchor protein [Devosiaceae bacterium]